MLRSTSWVAVCCAVCVLAFASDPAQGDITDDLYAYWDMDGDFSDAIDSNHDGTLLGTSGSPTASFVTGKFGQAIDIDRADSQRIQIGDAANESDFDFVDGTISISLWFTVENFDESWQALIAKGEGTSWRIARRSDNNVMGYAGGTGDIPGSAIGPDVTGGEWHNIVAITENGVSTRLWVDGGLVATSAGAPAITNNNDNPMLIGGNPDTGPGFRTWNGNIDDVGIWTRAITEDEIAYLWNDGAGRPVIPEPTSAMLAALGLLALGMLGRRRK